MLYYLDRGYGYRWGTASFLNSYTYPSATGADADTVLKKALATLSMSSSAISSAACASINAAQNGICWKSMPRLTRKSSSERPVAGNVRSHCQGGQSRHRAAGQ